MGLGGGGASCGMWSGGGGALACGGGGGGGLPDCEVLMLGGFLKTAGHGCPISGAGVGLGFILPNI